MKVKSMIAALLLMLAALQTTRAQGFRVYKSDGTVAQFSFRTDSIVFYDGIGTDEDFGPFTPVNLCIAGTWYRTKSEIVTFGADGTTDYIGGATYEFLPYQGTLILYDAGGKITKLLRVPKATRDYVVLSEWSGETFAVLTRTQPAQLVTCITLSETDITLQPDESKRLTATVLPEDADNKELEWTSSNDAVAEVNSSGRVTANANGTCIITCTAADGSGVKAECKVTVNTTEAHEYVDLGLPSGTLWATCNIGAASPEEYGDYFAWGETKPKKVYSWQTYQLCNGTQTSMTKYCTGSSYGTVDNKTELEPEDDAATANWGSGWRMPSSDQMEELINSEYTTSTWTTQNGVNGRKITSKSNGNSIFLPAAGIRSYARLDYAGSNAFYWSRSLSLDENDYAYYLDFYSSGPWVARTGRGGGLCIRPVWEQ